MLNKIGSLARALGVVLAVISGFVAIPDIDVASVLVILGLFSGLIYGDAERTGLILVALVLPAVAAVLGTLPGVGTQLSTIAAGIGTVAVAAVATSLGIRIACAVKGDLMGLAGK